jgi:hypothetical protein
MGCQEDLKTDQDEAQKHNFSFIQFRAHPVVQAAGQNYKTKRGNEK